MKASSSTSTFLTLNINDFYFYYYLSVGDSGVKLISLQVIKVFVILTVFY